MSTFDFEAIHFGAVTKEYFS